MGVRDGQIVRKRVRKRGSKRQTGREEGRERQSKRRETDGKNNIERYGRVRG